MDVRLEVVTWNREIGHKIEVKRFEKRVHGLLRNLRQNVVILEQLVTELRTSSLGMKKKCPDTFELCNYVSR